IAVFPQIPMHAASRIQSLLGLSRCLFLMVATTVTTALQITGLQTPQSFLADPSGEQYFISNINGDPEHRDNNGFITKLDQDGKLVKLQFIKGGEGQTILHAPKGMAIIGQVLYVADLDMVRGFDKSSGQPVVTVSLANHAKGEREQNTALADLVHD